MQKLYHGIGQLRRPLRPIKVVLTNFGYLASRKDRPQTPVVPWVTPSESIGGAFLSSSFCRAGKSSAVSS